MILVHQGCSSDFCLVLDPVTNRGMDINLDCGQCILMLTRKHASKVSLTPCNDKRKVIRQLL